MTLSSSDFGPFFETIWGYSPMQWQVDAAASACNGIWPDYISLPTGAGKTSTIDIAIFALAFQASLPSMERTAPMRTYLVVDRRTVVNEAFHRAKSLQEQLAGATEGLLKTVADQLRSYSGGAPLAIAELRGGIYRDPSWCDSLTQPMIVTSTVDQVGSRLLFRGYGVSNSSRPVQAALIAHDSLIILDEAHISKPFSQTLEFVKTYQQPPWASKVIPLPLRVVEMTATPPDVENATTLCISEDEQEDASTHIGNIVNTPKITTLEVAGKVKGAKAPEQLGKVLAEKAISYVDLQPSKESQNPLKVVGVIVNTVATAKETYRRLLTNKGVDASNVQLIIGAMRPIDRDEQAETLRDQISTGKDRSRIKSPIFVVATQCIEVGADYDFDVLVTEAAPFDSLVQRFGRLNRKGRNDITAVGHVIMRGDRVRTRDQLKTDDNAFRYADPIYGNALCYTWNWLVENSDDATIDFGIMAFRRLSSGIDVESRKRMSVEEAGAPVLLPSHVDLLSQTTIDPHPSPDVSVWLHGPQRNDADVQVCWRADLIDVVSVDEKSVSIRVPVWSREARNTIHAVSLCPPSAAECMSVRLGRMRKWLASLATGRKVESDVSGDVVPIVESEEQDIQEIPSCFRPVAWRGPDKSVVIANASEIRPGDTLAFSVVAEGWEELGFIKGVEKHTCDDQGNPLRQRLLEAMPGDQVKCCREDFSRVCGKVDVGSRAFVESRDRPIARIHSALTSPQVMAQLAEAVVAGKTMTSSELAELTWSIPDEDLRAKFDRRRRLRFEFYEDALPEKGLVIVGQRLSRKVVLSPEDDGDDLYSRIETGEPISLADHSDRVLSLTESALAKVSLGTVAETLRTAALRHDWGKADLRFQAMLFGGDLFTAYLRDGLFAKSDGVPRSLAEQRRIRERAELPKNFRHELLSMSLIEVCPDNDHVEDLQLLLHLVATHHGYARPWTDTCHDNDPPAVELEGVGAERVALTAERRRQLEYHAIDAPMVERFWEMIRKYGWWGVAYLESILRFADRKASQIESHFQNQHEVMS